MNWSRCQANLERITPNPNEKVRVGILIKREVLLKILDESEKESKVYLEGDLTTIYTSFDGVIFESHDNIKLEGEK